MSSLYFVFVFMCYLCEKSYKLITIQYYIVKCVSLVPRLTLLDLGTNWTYEWALGMGLTCSYVGNLCVSLPRVS